MDQIYSGIFLQTFHPNIEINWYRWTCDSLTAGPVLGTDDDAIVRRIVSIVFSAVIRLKYPHTAQATATSRRWHCPPLTVRDLESWF